LTNTTSNLNDALNLIDPDDLAPDTTAEDAIQWSHYQEAIFEFVKNGEGNAVVEATAGSGKTSTLIQALSYTDTNAQVAFVAFNKHIADELSRRAPPHVYVSTLHSLGLKNLTRHLGHGVKVEKNKTWMLLDDASKSLPYQQQETVRELGGTIKQLLSLSKAWLLPPTPENLDYLSERYGIHVNGKEELVYRLVATLHNRSLQMLTSMIDFDDMIYATASNYCAAQKFDIIFVDELQDLNRGQAEFVLASAKPTSRIIGVGDTNQAIYGFAGSDTESMSYFKERISATELPLSITYRCPRNVVTLAQELVPHIEARPNAPDGIVRTIMESQLTSNVEEGDFVVCRVNAPLVRPAFALIQSGIKAVILGRDIGKNLSDLIRRIQKRTSAYDLGPFLRDLADYRASEVMKLMNARKESRAVALDDQVNTIVALSSDCETIADLHDKIKKVFDDQRKGVTFSSIHKAKGLEANRVFILYPDNTPHKMSKQPWQLEQEYNLKYVAITRAKNELVFVMEEK
jgi:DNA helicase II / ATP-dependent DNA helicase PcrA